MERNRPQKHIYISLYVTYVAFQIQRKVEFIRSRLNDHLTPYTVNFEWIKDLCAHTHAHVQTYKFISKMEQKNRS